MEGLPICRSLVQQIQCVMRSVHLSPHNLLCLQILQLCICFIRRSTISLMLVRTRLWSSQRLRASNTAPRCQRWCLHQWRIRISCIRTSRHRRSHTSLSCRRGGAGALHLSAIARNIVIIIAIQTVGLSIIRLAFSSRRREETFLALARATFARRWMWIVDRSQIALHFAPTAGNACLIHPFVRGVSSGRRLRLSFGD